MTQKPPNSRQNRDPDFGHFLLGPEGAVKMTPLFDAKRQKTVHRSALRGGEPLFQKGTYPNLPLDWHDKNALF